MAKRRKIPPIHPGEILREEFLKPLGMTPHALAKALAVPAPRINDIVLERRSISIDTARRLAAYFKMSFEFWIGLQNAYDLELERDRLSDAELLEAVNVVK